MHNGRDAPSPARERMVENIVTREELFRLTKYADCAG